MKNGDKKIQRFEDIVGWQKARELVERFFNNVTGETPVLLY